MLSRPSCNIINPSKQSESMSGVNTSMVVASHQNAFQLSMVSGPIGK
jgi:hypothetical protein